MTTTTYDIAAILSAILYPVVLLIIFLLFRKEIPAIVKGIAGRLTKIEIAGVSLELLKAEPIAPDWQNAPENIDLRHHAQGAYLADSTADAFFQQLVEEDQADYAIVDLGTEREWLSTRLYILSIVFQRTKGIEGIVFLETVGDKRKRFLGLASPDKVRWCLAKRYPWLEGAYAIAYASIFKAYPFAKITSANGQLGRFNSGDDHPGATPVSIELLQRFIREVQNKSSELTTLPPHPEWETLSDNTSEAASWLTSQMIEDILGTNLKLEFTDAREDEQLIKETLAMTQPFVPVVDRDRRFKFLLKRQVLLEQIGKQELKSLEAETV